MRSALSFASLTRRLPVWAYLWVLAFGFHRLDAGTVTARLEPDSIAVGETATLQLIFKDMGSVAAPELPALPNCSIQHAGSSVQFVVGTEGGFAVLRDPIACKPAVMAETSDYVAFGSEYRALAMLPNIEKARLFEPEPAKVYVWEH